MPSVVAPMVCLVDDDSSVRKSLTRLLESAGYKVNAFDEPETFLQHLAHDSVPLVVLDIWMDHTKGMELLVHLCARFPQTRVIFVTAQEDQGAKTTVMQAGAFAFFIKPFDSAQFLKTVQRALSDGSPENHSRKGASESH